MSCTFKFAVAAAFVSAVLAPAALAQTPDQPVSFKVAFGDLNMSSPAGGKILLGRIQSAARNVCGKAIPRSPLTPRALTLCRSDTVEHVVREMGIATLTAAWARDPATRLASR